MKRMLVAAAAAIALGVAVPNAVVAGVSGVGFYTRNPAASAPERGFQVSNAPDGIVSYGAVQVAEAGDTIGTATLTLTESGQQVNNTGAVLRACPAVGTFKSGKGTLTDGPKADCEAGNVALTRAPDGKWSADVTELVAGADSPAVAVVPASGFFQLTFGPPAVDVETKSAGGGAGLESSFDASEFGGTSTGGSSSGGSSGSDSSDFGGSSGSSSDFGSSSGSTFDTGTGSSLGSFDGGSLVTGPAEAAPAITTASPEVAAAPTPAAGETPLPARRRLTGTTASSSSGGSWGQFFFFVVAALAIGGGAGFARNRLVTSRAS